MTGNKVTPRRKKDGNKLITVPNKKEYSYICWLCLRTYTYYR